MFQSTLPRGERQLQPISGYCVSSFQSTLPRGERPSWSYCRQSRRRFNPRSRVGSDYTGVRRRGNRNVSIHAPAWGATGARLDKEMKEQGFNPRSRVGSDRLVCFEH